MNDNVLIRAESVCKNFSEKPVLKGIDLEIRRGEVVVIIGPSGSGKSMTLKCIAGLERPSKGKIIVNNKVLFDSEKKIDIKTKSEIENRIVE